MTEQELVEIEVRHRQMQKTAADARFATTYTDNKDFHAICTALREAWKRIEELELEVAEWQHKEQVSAVQCLP